VFFSNCVATENGGYGFNMTANKAARMVMCPAWSNTSGDYTGLTTNQMVSSASLSGDPFTASDGSAPTTTGYLSPDATAGEGAVLRGLAFPASYPYLTGTTNYKDIGAIGHADPAGGGGSIFSSPVIL
jgi:hypothetical protein